MTTSKIGTGQGVAAGAGKFYHLLADPTRSFSRFILLHMKHDSNTILNATKTIFVNLDGFFVVLFARTIILINMARFSFGVRIWFLCTGGGGSLSRFLRLAIGFATTLN